MTYNEYIENILTTRGRFACGEEYGERHNILPKRLGGSDEDNNLMDLYGREHDETHKLLAKENPENEKLTYAWWMMSHCAADSNEGRYKLTPEEYEEARIAFSKMRSENSIGENNHFFGKHHTEETREKMKENHADVSGDKNPMYRKGYKVSGSKNGMYGVHRYGKDSPNYGKKWTEKQKANLSKKLKGKGGVPVYCVELNEKFSSMIEAEEKYSIKAHNIGQCINGRQKTAGKHPITGERLHWRRID